MFNMGMGMIAITRPQDAAIVMSAMEGSVQIGRIEDRPSGGDAAVLSMEPQ